MSLTALLFAALALSQSDPLAPAREDQVQCYMPNVAAKTCRAIGAYRWAADGSITNDASVALNAAPLVILNSATPVYVRDGGVCTRTVPAATQTTSILVNGTALTGSAFEAANAQVGAAVDGLYGVGTEVCTTYPTQADGTLQALVTVNGTARPELTSPVIWVRPSDGWRVAP